MRVPVGIVVIVCWIEQPDFSILFRISWDLSLTHYHLTARKCCCFSIDFIAFTNKTVPIALVCSLSYMFYFDLYCKFFKKYSVISLFSIGSKYFGTLFVIYRSFKWLASCYDMMSKFDTVSSDLNFLRNLDHIITLTKWCPSSHICFHYF